jgi:hypothetical protein
VQQPDWLGKLKDKRDRLREWLARYRNASEVAPEVQKNLEITEWQIATIESRPQEADEVPLPDLLSTSDSDVAFWGSALPSMPDYDKQLIVSASPFSTSGTVSIHEYASRVGDLGTAPAIEFAASAVGSLDAIYKRHDRSTEVARAVGALGSTNLGERLTATARGYQDYAVGGTARAAVAILMRNLVDGLKGELWQRARTHPSENMTWELMADRIAIGGSGTPQHTELLKQEGRHASFVARLSDVAKDREGGSARNLDLLWTEIQDYILTILRLVKT